MVVVFVGHTHIVVQGAYGRARRSDPTGARVLGRLCGVAAGVLVSNAPIQASEVVLSSSHARQKSRNRLSA